MATAKHILVLEDEPVIRELVTEVLTLAGLTVTSVETVAGARAALAAGTFDLAISDFLLPDGTGLEFARGARETAPSLRIVLVTAYLEPELADQVRGQPSIVEVMRKPMDVFQLREAVSRLLREGGEENSEQEVEGA